MNPDYENLVFFGDSLTDNGTVYRITSELLTIPFPLSSAGYEEVFSNGPVYSQILPGLLDADTVRNYAVGGARALGSRPISELGDESLFLPLLRPGVDPALLGFDINLGAQIGRFLAEQAADPIVGPTTAFLNMGLNDFRTLANEDPETVALEGAELVARVTAATLGAAVTLASQGGVDRVVFYTFPEATFFPLGQEIDPAVQPLADALIEAHAAAIKLGAFGLELAGIDTEVIDLDEIGDEITADMGTFGFRSLGPVLIGTASDPQVGPNGLFFPMNPAVAGLDEDEVVFFDRIHPTTELHEIFAIYSASVLEDRTVFLNDLGNWRIGSRGDDFVLAKGGDDVLLLRDGDDTAFAGLGHDRVWGQDGSDIIAGGSGDDTLDGGDGSDVLAGNAGNDRAYGGDGADALIDGLGSDMLFGGGGGDFFFHTEASLVGGTTGADADRFFGGGGYDTLFLAVSDANLAAAEAEIAGGAGPLGTYFFEALNLSLVGFEEVLLRDRADFGDAPVAAELEQALQEADLWGLV